MLVPDAVPFVLVFCIAIITFLLTFYGDEPDEPPTVDSAKMSSALRRPMTALLCLLSWAVLSAMSFSLNNCSTQFNESFTTILETTTTSNVYANSFSIILGLFCAAIAFVMIPVTFLFFYMNIYRPLKQGYLSSKGGSN